MINGQTHKLLKVLTIPSWKEADQDDSNLTPQPSSAVPFVPAALYEFKVKITSML